MNKTPIEWTDFTWNQIRARMQGAKPESACDCPCKICTTGHCGHPPCDQMRTIAGTFCTRISPGCTNCYASVINKRFGNGLEYTVPNLERVEFYIDERILEEPVHRKKPARIFVGDMFDLFHESIPAEFIAEVLRVALKTPRHTFQFLTKRAERMRNLVNRAQEHWGVRFGEHMWFGVSVEDQQRADERIPLLLQTQAAVRFLSVEPMLEEVNLQYFQEHLPPAFHFGWLEAIHWVICGGESGQQARPMHPNWASSLRDQCQDANVPFFFKQWGEWMPHPEPPNPKGSYHGGIFLMPNGRWGNQGDWWEGRAQAMDKVGKKKAGALLDGREWREFPSLKAEVVLA